MSYATTQTMTIGATVLTLPAPQPGYICAPSRVQNEERNYAGALRVVDHGVALYRTTLTVILPRDVTSNQDYAAFKSFWNSRAVGALNAFTWVDWRATSHASARFVDGPPEVDPPNGELRSVTFTIETSEAVE